MEIKTRLNADRWIVDMPCCNGAERAYPGMPVLCGNQDCNDIGDFKMLKEIVFAITNGNGKIYHPLHGVDVDQAIATIESKCADRLYIPVFPEEKEKIEKIMSERPEKVYLNDALHSPRNWDLEPIEELDAENKKQPWHKPQKNNKKAAKDKK